MLGLGAANVTAEVAGEGKGVVVGAGVVAWGALVGWRWRRQPEVFRAWGFRWDNAGRAARALTLPVLAVATALLAVGASLGQLPPLARLIGLAMAYLPWGVAQQFLLNAILVRNLEATCGARAAAALGALLFSASHAPDWPVVALTLPAGWLWAEAYRRHPNLWVLGASHALLGALAFTALLERDPLAELFGGVLPAR